MRTRRDRREADAVRAVVAGLARLVAADGGSLRLRDYDAERRALDVVLAGTPGCAVDASLVTDFLTEALCLHGIRLSRLRVQAV
ncbi:hypothetical protein [Prauserella muralis]|uniref:Uncharacterized protein n=1 Tax=Prauserella muralis TaxID=588067 RepID=A0A2V4AKJ8_9PSEU|nr:hypothetical protein [Prauserella muralis]PXY20795.1 hypothetical protein BAY60_25105 [Prauserella muralis]TWE29818.1 hypothetical protein FHX69_2508 [Prauserella muralis]